MQTKTTPRVGVWCGLFRAWRSQKAGVSIGQQLSSWPRMLRAKLNGSYSGLSWDKILLFAGALGYIVSPIDLMPEAFLTVFGLGDDAAVVAWIFGSLLAEAQSFELWEHGQRPGAKPQSGTKWADASASPDGAGFQDVHPVITGIGRVV